MMARPLASTATSRTGLISASLDTQLTCVPSASRERLPTDGRRYAEELSWPDGPAKPPGMSADGGRPAFGGCRQLWVPSAHLARVAERGAGELQGRRARIGGGADLVPVQDVLAQGLVPAGTGRGQASAAEGGRCRVRIGVESRLRVPPVARPPADLDELGVGRVAGDEVS